MLVSILFKMDEIYYEKHVHVIIFLLNCDVIFGIEARSHILPFSALDILNKYENAVSQIHQNYIVKIVLVLLTYCHGHMFLSTDYAQSEGLCGW